MASRSVAEPVTWIVVANAGCARIFEESRKADAPLGAERPPVPAPRPPVRPSAGDWPGAGFAGRQPVALPADPLRCAKQEFARELIHTLDEARRHGDFDELVIAAAPAFLGDIRAFMPAPLRACLRHEINKDFTGLPDPDLQRHIRQHL